MRDSGNGCWDRFHGTLMALMIVLICLAAIDFTPALDTCLENGNHYAEKVSGDRAIRDLRQPSGASLQPLQVLILLCDLGT